jgi:hypothetical protein
VEIEINVRIKLLARPGFRACRPRCSRDRKPAAAVGGNTEDCGTRRPVPDAHEAPVFRPLDGNRRMAHLNIGGRFDEGRSAAHERPGVQVSSARPRRRVSQAEWHASPDREHRVAHRSDRGRPPSGKAPAADLPTVADRQSVRSRENRFGASRGASETSWVSAGSPASARITSKAITRRERR